MKLSGDWLTMGRPPASAGGGCREADCRRIGVEARPLTSGRMVGAFVWLLFIVFPLLNALGNGGPVLGHLLTVAAAAVFVICYVVIVLVWRRRPGDAPPWRRRREARLSVGLFAVMVAIAAALTVAERPGWGFLFTYCAACMALLPQVRLGVVGLIACTALSGITPLIGGGDGGSALGFAASTAGIGLLMLLMRDLRVRNAELIEARAELAELAVAEERERFARDLHDLLGHSLSVIALKAELAGRLLPDRPEQAAREVADVESVARGALGEVREAVSGYRQPTLDGELEGARMALAAAGIEAEVARPRVAIDPAAEAVLAWAVREGATNVIRHSRASRCTLRISATLGRTVLEVVDDGVGAEPAGAGPAGAGPPGRVAGQANGAGGHGLSGLVERAELVRGRVEADSRPGGGFRLAVSVPVAAP